MFRIAYLESYGKGCHIDTVNFQKVQHINIRNVVEIICRENIFERLFYYDGFITEV